MLKTFSRATARIILYSQNTSNAQFYKQNDLYRRLCVRGNSVKNITEKQTLERQIQPEPRETGRGKIKPPSIADKHVSIDSKMSEKQLGETFFYVTYLPVCILGSRLKNDFFCFNAML